VISRIVLGRCRPSWSCRPLWLVPRPLAALGLLRRWPRRILAGSREAHVV